jgi:16S rRNA (uracil1498-N3)-methyltransferase
MAHYDFRTPRIYLDAPLAAGAEVRFDHDQANHLVNVLRRKSGDAVLLFNGRDGEWTAQLATGAKRTLAAVVDVQMREQPDSRDLQFLFAPLKHARLDYLVQKVVEMGASRLQPVITRHTQVARINLARMRANVIEAAQQCGVLTLTEVAEPVPFDRAIRVIGDDRLLVFCDEEADVADPVATLAAHRPPVSAVLPTDAARTGMALAVLIGPEGGFAEGERAALLMRTNVVRLALGPRILRADTAAVAALTLVQAVLGDWRDGS